jgi:hypothetical protein
LSGQLAATLKQMLPTTDERVWFIRRLHVDLDLNAGWNEAHISRVWARHLAVAVARAIVSGADGGNVLWFASRPAYLARFLVDLARGQAWDKWYYESFDGLKMLPVSAALRTVLCDDPTIGQAALSQLSAADLRTLTGQLAAPDAERVLTALCAGCPTESAAVSVAERIASAVAACPTDFVSFIHEGTRAFYWYQHVIRRDPHLAGAIQQEIVRALCCLARLTLQSDTAALLRALGHGDPGDIVRCVGPRDAERLRILHHVPLAVLRTMIPRVTHEAVPETSRVQGVRYTPFGGVFLLLPILARLPLDALTQDWEGIADARAASILRMMLVARCYGPQGQAIVRDPLLRDLFEISPSVDQRELDVWQRSVLAPHSEAVVDCLRDWLRANYDASDEGHEATVCKAGCRVTVLLSDGDACDFWQDVRIESAGSRQGPGPAVAARVQQRVAGDVHFLLPGERTAEEPPEAAAALMFAAHTVLRAFSRRLPGFARSSLPYLAANFLDLRGSLEDEAERRVVRLEKPPLDVVLQMSGAARGSYCVNWLDCRPFVLFSVESR